MSASDEGSWAAEHKGMMTEGHDEDLLLQRQHGGPGPLRAHERITEARALTPFLHGGGADTVAPSQGSYAFLTSLNSATNRLCRGGAAVEKLSHSPSFQEELIVPPLHGTEHSADELCGYALVG
jgi:hypothetical protein